jgi:hypothetical protein
MARRTGRCQERGEPRMEMGQFEEAPRIIGYYCLEAKLRHLELMRSAIARMVTNSVLFKRVALGQ